MENQTSKTEVLSKVIKDFSFQFGEGKEIKQSIQDVRMTYFKGLLIAKKYLNKDVELPEDIKDFVRSYDIEDDFLINFMESLDCLNNLIEAINYQSTQIKQIA